MTDHTEVGTPGSAYCSMARFIPRHFSLSPVVVLFVRARRAEFCRLGDGRPLLTNSAIGRLGIHVSLESAHDPPYERTNSEALNGIDCDTAPHSRRS